MDYYYFAFENMRDEGAYMVKHADIHFVYRAKLYCLDYSHIAHVWQSQRSMDDVPSRVCVPWLSC